MSTVAKVLCFTCLLGLSVLPAQARHHKPKPTVPIVSAPALSAIDKQHVLQDPFVTVTTVQAIPHSVLVHLVGQGPEAGMADAGQPFQEGDVVLDPSLPLRRLVFAALSKDYCLVYNQFGGYGEGTEVSLYHLSAGQATLVWNAGLGDHSGSLSLAQLQNEINKGDFVSVPLQEYAQKSFYNWSAVGVQSKAATVSPPLDVH